MSFFYAFTKFHLCFCGSTLKPFCVAPEVVRAVMLIPCAAPAIFHMMAYDRALLSCHWMQGSSPSEIFRFLFFRPFPAVDLINIADHFSLLPS
jgi:hypothetical protein